MLGYGRETKLSRRSASVGPEDDAVISTNELADLEASAQAAERKEEAFGPLFSEPRPPGSPRADTLPTRKLRGRDGRGRDNSLWTSSTTHRVGSEPRARRHRYRRAGDGLRGRIREAKGGASVVGARIGRAPREPLNSTKGEPDSTGMGGYGRRFDPPATRRLGSGSPGRSPHASSWGTGWG